MTISLSSIRYRYPNTPFDQWDLDLDQFFIQPSEFVLVIGSSGSGKSTLLRIIQGLIPDFYGGVLQWEHPILNLKSGFVMQDPDMQMIMPDVESELIFGMEQHGLSQHEMQERLVNLNHWYDWNPYLNRQVESLSGGEKQRLLLSAISLLDPDLLILDEPTAQLDNDSIEKLVDKVRRWKDQDGHAVLIADHRISHWLPLADRVMVMENGRVAWTGSVTEWYQFADSHPLYRDWLPFDRRVQSWASESSDPFQRTAEAPVQLKDLSGALHIRQLDFQFANAPELFFKQLEATIPTRQLTALTGANGSGKSTLLKLISGLCTPIHGSLRLTNGPDISNWSAAQRSCWIGYVSQNPFDHLLHDSILHELKFSLELIGMGDRFSEMELQSRIQQIAEDMELSNRILHSHPRDLSSGERQRAALASVLIRNPHILLLDEPSRGLSVRQKEKCIRWLHAYKENGGTALIVTHDLEFASEWADAVSILDHSHVGVWKSTTAIEFFGTNHRLIDAIQLLRLKRERGSNP